MINERLDLVSHFLEGEAFREDIVHLLCRTHDSQRLVQKFSLGRGDADDLLDLSRTIEATKTIAAVLEAQIGLSRDHLKERGTPGKTDSSIQPDNLRTILNRLYLDGPTALAERILGAIDEEGLVRKHRMEDDDAAAIAASAQEVIAREASPEEAGEMPKKLRSKVDGKSQSNQEQETYAEETWIMRKDASRRLSSLHQDLDDLLTDRSSLADEMRDQSNMPSLTLRWTPGLGHICHVKGNRDISKGNIDALGHFRVVNSTKSTKSFYHPRWTSLGGRIDQAKDRIRNEEQLIFEDLRDQVIANLIKLRRNAGVLDELDVACSFAVLAGEQQFVRPILNKSTTHKIVGGRHPTVTLGLEEQGRSFVSNDCFIGDAERIWLVTGPNMAGKSTFLRQNALISILAQVGSFVPAEHAEIGIVDQIFSRIGAADDLFRNQSTFMVEMLETATILKNATPRSFVIMDEVGRGTTPEDGVAVGYACLHHLHYTNQCRTLFATHFHALADMTAEFESVGRYCTDVDEDDTGSFSYVHKLRKGVNRQSHALKVARLAGLPEAAIAVARETLQRLRKGD